MAAGCHPSGRSIVSSWQQRHGGGLRAPAQSSVTEPTPSQRCFFESLDAERLRREVATESAHASWGAAPAQVNWHGATVQGLDAASAAFLSGDGGRWLPEGVNTHGCSSAPCLINRAYGKPDEDDAGYMHFLWWLKTGYALGARAEIPGMRLPRGAADRDYFFSPAELRALWKTIHALPPAHLRLRTLQSLHRLPPGVVISGWVSTCADATGTESSGYIRLSDRCLPLPENESAQGFNGFFYLAVLHEISHRLDYAMGPGGYTRRRWNTYSLTEEWQTAGGWNCAVLRRRRREQAQLVCGDARDDFVRAYAGTNALEDFADTVAHYRFAPDLTWRQSPNKAALLKERVFGGKSYARENLMEGYEAQVLDYCTSRLARFLEPCVAVEGPSSSCVSGQVDRLVTEALGSLKHNEPEACGLLIPSHTESVLTLRIKGQLSTRTAPLLAELRSQVGLREAQAELRRRLETAADPAEIYLRCRGARDPQACAQGAFVEAFRGISADFAARYPVAVEAEQAHYLRGRDFTLARQRFDELFDAAFGSLGEPLRASANGLWARCTTTAGGEGPAPDTVPVEPFSGRDRYVHGRILACINGSMDRELNALISAHLERERLERPDEALASEIRPRISARYLTILDERLEDAAHREDAQVESLRAGWVATIKSDVLAEPQWIGVITDAQGIAAACVPAARRFFDAHQASDGESNRIPALYRDIADLREEWGQAACATVAEHRIVQSALRANCRGQLRGRERQQCLRALRGSARPRARR